MGGREGGCYEVVRICMVKVLVREHGQCVMKGGY